MRYLYNRNICSVDGYDGSENNSSDYVISYDSDLKSFDEMTEPCIEEGDYGFHNYYEFENIGEITESEIETLKKFRLAIEI